MKSTFKRLLSMLLVLFMVGSMLPVFHAHAAETEESNVLTDEDYAIVNDVFAQIDNMENAPAKKNATQTQLTDAAIQIVENSANYVEGSIERNGNSFTWWTDEGIRCIYNPRMRRIYNEMEAPADPEPAGIYNAPKTTKGGWPAGNQVYLIAPYYGLDDSFTDQYKNEATSIASAIGDTDGYTLCSGSAVTVDTVADAMENGAVVIFDSHGTTDYDGKYIGLDPDGYEVWDYVSDAKYSYLCLTNKTGLTSADYADGATYFTDSEGMMCACINGATIANHMSKNSPAGLLWMAICLGMATDTICEPMREMGVEVVYGYSQSVTFAGDYCFEETFWDNMISGKTVAQSISAMKSRWGSWDWSEQIASDYGYSGSGYSLSEARKYRAAFPVVVSDEDAHPGQRYGDSPYGACSEQTVKSTYTLYSQYTVTAQSNNNAWGTVSVNGSTITATPATGYFAESATVIGGTATVTQNGNTFSVSAGSDCTVQINFAAKTVVSVNFAGANVSGKTGYAGDAMTLPTATAPEGYTFVGWTNAPLSGATTEKPSYYTNSFTPTGNTTLYALYSYVDSTSGGGSGDYVKVTSSADIKAGEYLIVYEAGSRILNSSLATIDAKGNYVSVTISNNTISAAEGDPYKFIVEEVNGGYALKGMNGKYISGTSGSNKINAGTTAAANTLSIGANGEADIVSNTSHMRYNTSDTRFRYYKAASYSSQQAVALYIKDGSAGVTYYISTLCAHGSTSNVAATPATCTQPGYTAGVQCDACGSFVSGHEVVAALGHSFGQWTTTTVPGCETAGQQQHTCATCGEVETMTLPATGHTVGEGTVTTPATCTTAGVMTYSCTACGKTTTEAIPATGHNYVANGQQYTCSVCGDSYSVPSSTTLHYVFSNYTAGTQYAEGEEHKLDDVVTLTINGAHLNGSIRLYAGSNAVFTSTNIIESIVVQAGYKSGTLNVYTSSNGQTWTLLAAQSTTSSYINYSFTMPAGCKYVMLEAEGAQIRISQMDIVVQAAGVGEPEDTVPMTVENGNYVIVTNSGNALTAMNETYNYGWMPTTAVTVGETTITGCLETNIFKLTYTESGYTIQDIYGRYIYMTGTYNTFNVDTVLPASGGYWSVEYNGDGTYSIVNIEKSKTISYNPQYTNFGAYASTADYECDMILAQVADCQHENTTETTVESTCAIAGSVTVTCDDCGDIISMTGLPLADHAFADGVCGVCGAADPDYVPPVAEPTVALEFQTASLTLANSLAINFKAYKEIADEYTDLYAIFTMNGKSVRVDEYYVSGKYIVFDFPGIAANHMNSVVSAVLYGKAKCNGQDYVSTKNVQYGVYRYCQNMLGKYWQDPAEAKFCTAMVDLLNYGAAAQLYNNYKTDNLANNWLNEGQKALATQNTPAMESVQGYEVEIENPKVTFSGASLVLDSAVVQRIRVNINVGDVSDYTYVVRTENGKTWTYTAEDLVETDATDAGVKRYYIYMGELFSTQMSTKVFYTVYEGDTIVSHTFRYSTETFAYKYQDSTNPPHTGELLVAMIKYGNAVKAYAYPTNS